MILAVFLRMLYILARNVTQLLEFMVSRGEVAVAGRRGGDRLWDLATRVYPADPVVPADEALPG